MSYELQTTVEYKAAPVALNLTAVRLELCEVASPVGGTAALNLPYRGGRKEPLHSAKPNEPYCSSTTYQESRDGHSGRTAKLQGPNSYC